MKAIGKIDASGNGTIRTLAHSFRFKMVKVTHPQGDQPTHKFLIDGLEIGSGWKKKSKAGRDYVSATFDDPSFAAPIYTKIFDGAADGGYDVLWARPEERESEAA